MKRSFLALAVLALFATSGVFASKTAAVNPQPTNIYTYYLQGACDIPYTCSNEFEGPVCSDYFFGSIVYDSQGCVIGHETTNILGKLPL